MGNLVKALCLAAIVVLISCSDRSIPPEFNDSGSTLKNLKSTYNYESIEFDNWEEDDATDSTLTICLINSKTLPTSQQENQIKELKSIAAQIKRALKKPESFHSYYVIFIKKEGNLLYTTKTHTLGMDIHSRDL